MAGVGALGARAVAVALAAGGEGRLHSRIELQSLPQICAVLVRLRLAAAVALLEGAMRLRWPCAARRRPRRGGLRLSRVQ